jgi:hypothetical protein
MDVRESPGWKLDGLDMSSWLQSHLAPAAMLAFSHPFGDIRGHAPPDDSCRHQPPGSPGPWICQAVDGGESLPAVSLWDQRPSHALAASLRTLTPSITTGCIDSTGDLMAKSVSGQVSWLAAMVRKSMRPSKTATAAAHEGGEEFDLTRRALLHRPLPGKLLRQGRRRRCPRPRQHVSNHVVWTGNMANVAGMLVDVAELPALPGSPWV